ncbi:hypothetical protein NDU88_007335 [Pleurodeles waltl]|uniref:Uncharacterized protein n=1 Tax=Pleurodeles waltl TaxID=8319 RepID=A0AAV7UNJ1_PLEWA|nr:hypothetical protein NDU88_007335 [Pleurodeles waltl]
MGTAALLSTPSHEPPGEEVNTQHDIVTVFRDHLERVYQNPVYPDPDRLGEYLTKVHLPQLNETWVQALEADLTLEEVTVAIKSLPLGRSPGIDRFTAELYQTFVTVVALRLLAVYNEAFNDNILPYSKREGLIAMIPKSGTAASDPASYHPITMINLDAKVLCKILAARLATEDSEFWDLPAFRHLASTVDAQPWQEAGCLALADRYPSEIYIPSRRHGIPSG